MFKRIANRIKNRAIKKATAKIEKVIESKGVEVVKEENVKQVLLSLAISILEKFGKEYIEKLQEEFKDGIDGKDFVNALKRAIKE